MHLFDVHVPMLFLQGTRDHLADVELLVSVTQRLGEDASLHLFQDADHSFHVPARSGRKDADIRGEMLDIFVEWTLKVTSGGSAALGDRVRD
jgi:pimeloyl-ACP methyl ester carboxylesterase